jgi:hypothetical protein
MEMKEQKLSRKLPKRRSCIVRLLLLVAPACNPVGNIKLELPDLKDPNRNFAIKKLAEEIVSPEVLAKIKQNDPEFKSLETDELTTYMIKLEAGNLVYEQQCIDTILTTTASLPESECCC